MASSTSRLSSGPGSGLSGGAWPPRPRLQPLLLLLLFHLAAACAALSTDIEIDLVYPRANLTVKPVWPFPVIWSIRNASGLWRTDEDVYPFYLNWTLYGYRDIDNPSTGSVFHVGEYDTSDKLVRVTKRPDGALVLIEPTRRSLVNATAKEFRLFFSSRLAGDCNATMPKWRSQNGSTEPDPTELVHTGHIDFRTSPDGMTVTEVLQDDRCPDFITSFGIRGSRPETGTSRCPVVSPQAPAPNPCGLEINQELLSTRLEQEMLDFALCPNGTWPDPTGHLAPFACNAPSSHASAKALGPRSSAATALVAGLALLWLTV